MAKFIKGQGGRPKGSANKMTIEMRTVKELVLAMFNEIQNDPKAKWPLRRFADKYPRDFYAIAAKLIPTEVHARINKVELHVIRTGSDLPENFAPTSATDNGHSKEIQYG